MKADVVDRLPTPVDDLVAAAGLMETSDYEISESVIQQMPRRLRRFIRSAGRKISGLIDRRERIIHVDTTLDAGKQRFVKLHEVSHDIFDWQRDLLLAHTRQMLLPSVRMRFEREANQGAAELLFQLDFLQRIARDYPVDYSTPFALAKQFGASGRATFRHWISGHHACVCGFVLGRHAMRRDELVFDRLECMASEEWSRQFGNRVFPSRMRLSHFDFLGPLVTGYERIDTQWTLDDLNTLPRTVNVQSFTNTYNNFVIVWVPEHESFLARTRKKPTIIPPESDSRDTKDSQRIWTPDR
ncbi:MAG: ImmA/IrrE family metallo-endopeptidase [Pseudomonadota bacterium]